ncbi:MAG: hypothetical protein HN576_04835 [Bacteriovoracaceae bacterium]|nr:hypothetical protein [Bacteriovoracaceae bacterium]
MIYTTSLTQNFFQKATIFFFVAIFLLVNSQVEASDISDINRTQFSSFLKRAQQVHLPISIIEKLSSSITLEVNPKRLKKYSAVALFQGSKIYINSNPPSINLLYHEFWHAYKLHGISESENKYFEDSASSIYGKYNQKISLYGRLVDHVSSLIYSDFVPNNIAVGIADEGVGAYIQDYVQIYLYLNRKIEKGSILNVKNLKLLMSSLCGGNVFGEGYNSITKETIIPNFPLNNIFKRFAWQFLDDHPFDQT